MTMYTAAVDVKKAAILEALGLENLRAHFAEFPTDAVVGMSCRALDCPISWYLKTRFPDEFIVAHRHMVTVGNVQVRTPEHVARFIVSIDLWGTGVTSDDQPSAERYGEAPVPVAVVRKFLERAAA